MRSSMKVAPSGGAVFNVAGHPPTSKWGRLEPRCISSQEIHSENKVFVLDLSVKVASPNCDVTTVGGWGGLVSCFNLRLC